MPNRSIRDEMQDVGRPRVGPASPDVQRQKMAEYEAGAHREAVDRMASQRAATPVSAARTPLVNAPTRDLSVLGAAQKLSGRGRQIENALKDAGA